VNSASSRHRLQTQVFIARMGTRLEERGMNRRALRGRTAALILAMGTAYFLMPLGIKAQRRAPAAPPGPPPTPEQAAPQDLTGYWVQVVTEDWRYRMVVPVKGDIASVPLNAEGQRIAK